MDIAWKIWTRFEDKQKLMWWTERIVMIIGILCILAGFFASYRLGEYMQAKRYAQNHTIFIQTN